MLQELRETMSQPRSSWGRGVSWYTCLYDNALVFIHVCVYHLFIWITNIGAAFGDIRRPTSFDIDMCRIPFVGTHHTAVSMNDTRPPLENATIFLTCKVKTIGYPVRILSYEWFHNGMKVVDDQTHQGATTDVLKLEVCSGYYRNLLNMESGVKCSNCWGIVKLASEFVSPDITLNIYNPYIPSYFQAFNLISLVFYRTYVQHTTVASTHVWLKMFPFSPKLIQEGPFLLMCGVSVLYHFDKLGYIIDQASGKWDVYTQIHNTCLQSFYIMLTDANIYNSIFHILPVFILEGVISLKRRAPVYQCIVKVKVTPMT